MKDVQRVGGTINLQTKLEQNERSKMYKENILMKHVKEDKK